MIKKICFNQSGMTLLEVMIATAILAIIAIYTSQSVQTAVQSKIKIESGLDRNSTLVDVLHIMERDINLAFNYKDINIELYNIAEKTRRERLKKKPNTKNPPGGSTPGTTTPGSSQPGATTPGASTSGAPTPLKPFKPKEQKIITNFIGESNNLNFTTLNYTRTHENEYASDQAEVGYFIKSCKLRHNKEKRTECLWRRINPIIDNEVEKDGTETVILEHVTKFELRYLGPNTDGEWIKEWKSNQKNDAKTSGLFPYAVEITLGYHDKSNANEKPVEMTLVASLRFPNNQKKEDKVDEQKTDPPTN